MTLETIPFDAAPHFADEEAQFELLKEALELQDAAFIAVALGTIARARGMGDIARKAGRGRQSLYKALSSDGDPRLSTLVGVLKALGLRLDVLPARPEVRPS